MSPPTNNNSDFAWASQAVDRCRGARWVRCALQVNPYGYLADHGKGSAFADEATYNAALIEACKENEVEVIAITDHYKIDSAAGLISDAEKAGITVFPGFEAVSSDGVHLLVLFESGTSATRINMCIGACDLHDHEAPSPTSKDHDAVSLMEKAHRDWGAMVIAAHAAGEGGLLAHLKGQTRIRTWKSPYLFAIALPGPAADAPQGLQPILANKNGSYRRERMPAVVNAKDVTEPGQLDQASYSCWLKMSEISLKALRMACLDPESRVRLASDPQPTEHAQLVAMRWDGGFLDGIEICFSDDLNVLIGGPGAGKSTVIESIRCVLEMRPEGSDSGTDHDGIVKQVLRSGTRVSLALRHPKPSPASYIVERTLPNPPVVRDAASGNELEMRPKDLLPRPEVFGQHEISEIAADPQLRTRLLERFRRVDLSRARELSDLDDKLEDNRVRIGEKTKAIGRCKERLAGLPRVEETLERFRKAGVEDQLKEQSHLVTEKQLFVDARDQLDPVRALIEELEEAIDLEQLPRLKAKEDGAIAVKLSADLNSVLDRFEGDADKALASLEQAVADAEKGFDALQKTWTSRHKEVSGKLEKTLKKLQRDEIDGQEFIDLRHELEELKPLRRELTDLEKETSKLQKKRSSLLVKREKLLATELRELDAAAKSASGRLGDRVRVRVTDEADRSPLATLISEAVSGRIKEATEAIGSSDSLSVRALAEAIRSGPETLEEEYGLTQSQAEKLAGIADDDVMRIEEVVFPTETSIELNIARRGEDKVWRRLEDLSKGQKATAILLILLLESEGPLVVDQPEDDLDNTFIFDDIVPSVRREKRARQFLFATHNANIPVLGDAELIVGLSPSGEAETGRAEVADGDVGSIDIESVRKLVEERLEGGHEAFERRREKYGV